MACAAAVALAAAVATPAEAAKTTKPVPGAWKVVPLFDMTSGGGLTVTKTSVRGIRVTPGERASTGCGTETVSVKGTFRLRKATRGGFTSWIVGRAAPATSDGVKTIAVKVTRGAERLDGAMKLIFSYDNRRTGSGELTFGDCTVEFDLRKR
jgi:hypothetical protein